MLWSSHLEAGNMLISTDVALRFDVGLGNVAWSSVQESVATSYLKIVSRRLPLPFSPPTMRKESS